MVNSMCAAIPEALKGIVLSYTKTIYFYNNIHVINRNLKYHSPCNIVYPEAFGMY